MFARRDLGGLSGAGERLQASQRGDSNAIWTTRLDTGDITNLHEAVTMEKEFQKCQTVDMKRLRTFASQGGIQMSPRE